MKIARSRGYPGCEGERILTACREMLGFLGRWAEAPAQAVFRAPTPTLPGPGEGEGEECVPFSAPVHASACSLPAGFSAAWSSGGQGLDSAELRGSGGEGCR